MRRSRSSTHSAARQPRPARRIPQRARAKLQDVTVCPNCHASYRAGRWTWQAAPNDARERSCPACQRIADRHPAGVLHVEGAFATSHRNDLIGLLRHLEERERSDHPLKRVISIRKKKDGFVVETTDAKLARAFGRALYKAYAGALDQPPTTADTENLVRVRWRRD
jgi:hypothetical protein